MKVLFLDIDGVLSCRTTDRQQVGRHRGERIDLDMLARLDEVLDRTGAQVVVSSAWRAGDAGMTVAAILRRAGLRNWRAVVDETPKRDTFRGHEIGEWLRVHPAVKAFAIVDDDNDMVGLSERLVKTSFETGLQREHVERLVAMLGASAHDAH